MRDTSIIYIIRRYGLNSKKLDPNYRYRFRQAIDDLDQFSTDSLKLVEVIDNVSEPEKSLSDRCMIEGCGKRIRYEAHVMNVDTGDTLVCGSHCCCTLLGLSKLKAHSFMRIEEALKEKAELEEWKKNNPETVKKLETLSKYNLPFYQPFIDEIETSALTPEDTEFINKVNIKLVIGDLKYLSMLDDLIKDDPLDIYKSIKNHSAQGKYLSAKQKDFIDRQYEKMLENRFNVTISVFNAYEYREYLKELGFAFNGSNKSWQKTVKGYEATRIVAQLENHSIPTKNIKID